MISPRLAACLTLTLLCGRAESQEAAEPLSCQSELAGAAKEVAGIIDTMPRQLKSGRRRLTANIDAYLAENAARIGERIELGDFPAARELIAGIAKAASEDGVIAVCSRISPDRLSEAEAKARAALNALGLFQARFVSSTECEKRKSRERLAKEIAGILGGAAELETYQPAAEQLIKNGDFSAARALIRAVAGNPADVTAADKLLDQGE